MVTENSDKIVFTKEFTRQESIPEAGITRAVELMRSGRLHRYNTAPGETAEAALLEKAFAAYVGKKYCLSCASCGSALYLSLKSAGVKPGDAVLCNAYTLAPVPGAIENAGGKVILVEIQKDYTIDLDDLDRKAKNSGAAFFMLSHMRGHIADMDRIMDICNRNSLFLIEDCAHTMGAKWDGRLSGTFGEIGCYSTQTYKHMNSGEGGLLVTDDDDVMAKAILFSGSYMLYDRHVSRPSKRVFEAYKKVIPNFSMRMDNLRAALLRPQLKDLDVQCKRWNERYKLLEEELNKIDHLWVPGRDSREAYVGSSIQFTIENTTRSQIMAFLDECGQRGVEIKWFGWAEPNGFTSSFDSWAYIENLPQLPQTKEILDFMCDFRIPLTFTLEDCKTIAAIIKQVAAEIIT